MFYYYSLQDVMVCIGMMQQLSHFGILSACEGCHAMSFSLAERLLTLELSKCLHEPL